MKKTLDFLRRLARHNEREWFNAHKDLYLEVKAETDDLAARLIAQVAAFDPEAAHLTTADCTYRIYRDTRFSTDKTPYKTHIGIFINPPYGKKSNRMGYYLHLEPGNCFAAAGTVCLPSKTVTAIRRSIYDNIEEYLDIVRDPAFAAVYPVIGENCVKTAPKGIPKDWPYLEYVRPRDFVTSHNLTEDQVLDPDLDRISGDLFRVAKPFNDFVNYAIDNPDSE